MKKLPLVNKIVEIIPEYGKGRLALYGDMRDRITHDRDLAYTSLIKGIEGMRKEFDGCELADHDKSYLAALTDIQEKVVKPLYGKK